MASLFSFYLFSLYLCISISSAARHHYRTLPHLSIYKFPRPSLAASPPEIQQACKATRFPDACEASLTRSKALPPNPNPLQIIQAVMAVSSENLNTSQSMVKSILDSSTGSVNRTNAAKSCLEILGYSQYRASSTDEVILRGRTKDARAWMSAALAYQYDCWSGLKYSNDTQTVRDTMSFINDQLIVSTSNALSMLLSYDVAGEDLNSWGPPKTERDGVWEGSGSGSGGPGLGFSGGFPSELTADVTVCKDGGDGCYKSVQEAVNAAPSNEPERRFVIRIKEGVYEETVTVPLEKKNVVLLGDGMGKTVITGALSAGQPGVSTYTSATVGVLGDGFMASGLTIQNTAGPDTHQAVAFRSDSDLSIIENCEFIGNQDTLYVHSLRQFYKACRIEGNVDFIFGNSASVFQDCEITIRPRQINPEEGETNTITAHGRNDPAQLTGFVFLNCRINGTEDYMRYSSNPKVHKNFLGRPWKEYSRTVYIYCNMEALITPEGWMPWTGDFALKTLYYGEFGNSGPGSDTAQRVNWSSQIPAERVFAYSVQSFIQGNDWIPTSS